MQVPEAQKNESKQTEEKAKRVDPPPEKKQIKKSTSKVIVVQS